MEGSLPIPSAFAPLKGSAPRYGFDGEPPWVIEPDKESVQHVITQLRDGSEWDEKRAGFIRRYAFKADGKSGKRTARQIKGIIGV